MERRRPPRGGGRCRRSAQPVPGRRAARAARRACDGQEVRVRLLEAVPGDADAVARVATTLYQRGDSAEKQAVLARAARRSTDRPGPGPRWATLRPGRARCVAHQRHPTRRRRSRAVRRRPPRRRRLAPRGRQGDLHGHRPRRRRRPRGAAPTTSCAAWCATTSPSVGRPGARCPPTPGGSCPPTSPPPPPGAADEDLRPAHPHDVAHHRRLRAHARRRGAGRRRAVVLAGAAAHERGHVLRLLRRPAGVGAVPGPAVRHPALRDDRPQPQGGQRRAVPGGARRAAALPRQGPRRRRR